MSTETVSLQIVYLRSNQESAMAAQQTFLNIKPAFQREYEAWDNKLKTRFIESILLGRAMNPIWTVHNEEVGSEEVLDGMHRLTTALHYLTNQFTIDSNYLCSLDKEPYKNKLFRDLSSQDQSRIRSYNFMINKLDSSYKNDTEKLQEMYEILNRSSRPLNNFEFNKPIAQPFYEHIGLISQEFLNTTLFENAKTKRGQLETEMIKILALSEQQLPKSFTSLTDICKKWQQTHIGETSSKVQESISQYGDLYLSTLERVKKYMDHYVQQGLCNNKTRDNHIPILFIITRSAALIKSFPVFTRILPNLYNHFKKIIIDGNIQETLKCQNRNAQFQRSLLSCIDEIIRTEIETSENEPRLFTKEQILEKKDLQKNLCAICEKLIEPHQHFDGDHIISWSSGGKTIPSNLQVVHRSCHHKK